MLAVNSALTISFYDETGRVLRLECGRLDSSRIGGYFSLWINNKQVWVTHRDLHPDIPELGQYDGVITWGEKVVKVLLDQYQTTPPYE